MKKLAIYAFALAGLLSLPACESDRDSNPVLQSPSTFVLNTPAYATSEIDMATSKVLNFTCSQPDYGFTAAVVYNLELSLTNSFTTSVAQAEAAEDGSLVADYAALDESYTTCTIATDAALFAKALQQLGKWEEDAVPAVQTVNVRLTAKVGNQVTTSNTVDIKVVPYYVELKDAPVEMWYLIGSCIGDGKWSNSVGGLGVSMYPMSIVDGYDYDKKTGQGELTFTGYLTPDGFKLVKTPGGWDDQWGQGDSFGTFLKNDGGSGNIAVPEAGYYTINLNTKSNKLTIEKADIAPTVYESICMAGDFNSWGNDAMIAVNAAESMAGHNHIWSFVLDATGGDTTAKFKLAPKDTSDGWEVNWGGVAFPLGYGTNGGANIPVAAGKYVVTFNDIDGSYAFTAIE